MTQQINNNGGNNLYSRLRDTSPSRHHTNHTYPTYETHLSSARAQDDSSHSEPGCWGKCLSIIGGVFKKLFNCLTYFIPTSLFRKDPQKRWEEVDVYAKRDDQYLVELFKTLDVYCAFDKVALLSCRRGTANMWAQEQSKKADAVLRGQKLNEFQQAGSKALCILVIVHEGLEDHDPTTATRERCKGQQPAFAKLLSNGVQYIALTYAEYDVIKQSHIYKTYSSSKDQLCPPNLRRVLETGDASNFSR